MKNVTGRHSPRLPFRGGRRVIAFSLLFIMLLTGILGVTGCDVMVPVKEDVIEEAQEEYYEELRASPLDFQVADISSVVTYEGELPVLTLLVQVYNPNSYPRSFRSVTVEIFDEEGRQQGFKTWTTQRSPFIVAADSVVPIAVSFPGKSEWFTAKASFSSAETPSTTEVHEGLEAIDTKPIMQGDDLGASVTLQNLSTASAVDVTVLAAGYNEDGELVAWAEGLQHWRTLGSGGVATFETGAFLGDILQVVSVRAYVSAYNG